MKLIFVAATLIALTISANASVKQCSSLFEAESAQAALQRLANTKMSRQDFLAHAVRIVNANPDIAALFERQYTGEYRLAEPEKASLRDQYVNNSSFMRDVHGKGNAAESHDLKSIAVKVLETDSHYLFRIDHGGKSAVQLVLDAYFLNQRQMMSTFAYRERSLIPDKTESALWTMMNYLDSVDKSAWNANYVAFDKRLWNIFVRRLNRTVAKFDFLKNPQLTDSQWAELYKIHDIKEPLYPSLGLSVYEAKTTFNQTGSAYVLSRLYRNDKPDPLKILNFEPALSHTEPLEMYLAVVSQVPVGGQLEVHAHKPAYVRLYQSMGFTVAAREQVTVMGETRTIATLVGSRDHVVETLHKLVERKGEHH